MVKVSGHASGVVAYAEPSGEELPTWLDLSVQVDAFAAAPLQQQSQHPVMRAVPDSVQSPMR